MGRLHWLEHGEGPGPFTEAMRQTLDMAESPGNPHTPLGYRVVTFDVTGSMWHQARGEAWSEARLWIRNAAQRGQGAIQPYATRDAYRITVAAPEDIIDILEANGVDVRSR